MLPIFILVATAFTVTVCTPGVNVPAEQLNVPPLSVNPADSISVLDAGTSNVLPAVPQVTLPVIVTTAPLVLFIIILFLYVPAVHVAALLPENSRVLVPVVKIPAAVDSLPSNNIFEPLTV